MNLERMREITNFNRANLYRDQRNKSLSLFEKYAREGDAGTALEHARDAAYLSILYAEELIAQKKRRLAGTR